MKGLIMEIKGLRAIVLLPGGEVRSVFRRNGWRVGMLVDPDAARSGGFSRIAAAMAAVLVLMLGVGGYQLIGSRGTDNVATRPADRTELTLPDPKLEAEAVLTFATSTPEPTADAISAPATSTPEPTTAPTSVHAEVPAATPTAAPQSARKGCSNSDDDDRYEICDFCGEMGHDDDDHCDFCKEIGHDDDHCPALPEGMEAETCDYCGKFGHDDDDCPSAPPGWDD